MNVKQTLKALMTMPINKSIMLSAKHGVGKSSIVRLARDEMSKRDGVKYGYWDVRLSQCEVGDIKGMPIADIQTGRTRFLKPEWWPTDADSKGVLFFDELNRASKDVMQAVFEICLDRRLDGMELPEGWRVVAAINASDDYDVADMDPALHDRWFHISFDPSQEDWLDWARSAKIHPAVIGFIARNKDKLDPPSGSMEAGEVYPSRRSWQSVSDCMVAMNLAEDSDPGFMHQVVSGWVGRGIGQLFDKFVRNEFSQIRPGDVLDRFDTVKEKVQKSAVDIEVISQLAIAVLNEYNDREASKIKDKQKQALLAFLELLDGDVFGQAWSLLAKGQRSRQLMSSAREIPALMDRFKAMAGAKI